MSEKDEDERMERAKRIRRMREGHRTEGNEQGSEEGDEEKVEAAESDGEEVADDETAAEQSDDDTSEFHFGDDADDVTDDPAADEGDDMTGQHSTGEATTDEGTTGESTADDAAAAAERAAQAATAAAGGATAESDDQGGATASPATAVEGIQDATGFELPDEDEIEAALEGDESPAAAGLGAVGDEETDDGGEATTEESTRVLEFALGDELYCLDIEYVEEIVKRETVTRVPNTPAYVEGVVDLRGQITTILDPKLLLDIDQSGTEQLIVVFDPDAFEEQGAVGWLVDRVRQVVPIVDSEVNDPPVADEYINGVVDREDEDAFVIWTDPDIAMRLATDGEGD